MCDADSHYTAASLRFEYLSEANEPTRMVVQLVLDATGEMIKTPKTLQILQHAYNSQTLTVINVFCRTVIS